MTNDSKPWWHRPPDSILDVLWITAFVCAVFWLFGSVGNWLNGYGWGLR